MKKLPQISKQDIEDVENMPLGPRIKKISDAYDEREKVSQSIADQVFYVLKENLIRDDFDKKVHEDLIYRTFSIVNEHFGKEYMKLKYHYGYAYSFKKNWLSIVPFALLCIAIAICSILI